MDGSAFQRFVFGMRQLPEAAGFLVRRPRLIPHVIGPVILAFVMVYGAWVASWDWTPWLLSVVWPRPPGGWVQGLWNGVAIFLVFWVFATTALFLYGALGVVGAPFYDRLSMAVERELRPGSLDDFGWREELRALGLSTSHSLLALVLWLGVLAGMVVFNIVPIVGSVLELALSTLATWFFAARESMDGVMSRRGMGFAAKARLLWAERAVVLGFGAGASLLVFVPFLNFLAIPVVVIGGTKLFLALEDAGRVTPSR